MAECAFCLAEMCGGEFCSPACRKQYNELFEPPAEDDDEDDDVSDTLPLEW